MSTQASELRSKRRPYALLGLSALLGVSSACAKIVGIEDTTVTRGEGSSGGAADQGGNSNATHAGSSNAGSPSAGHSNGHGGSSPSGGAAGTETSGGAPSSGGSESQAGNASMSGSAGSGGTGGSGGASECPCSAPKPTCENGKCVVRGPTMAKATNYYIDSTEVSKAQYSAFLAAKGSDSSGQSAECAWNNSYAPDGTVDDPRPIVNVDWCDAVAYCAWADKRLCGAIGGGALGLGDLKDTSKAQWYLACAGYDEERYPYGGSSLIKDNCNEYFSGNMADVGKFSKCEGHYTGIFDLVGNAAEWIDACDTSGGTDRAMDHCELGGGSYLDDSYTCQTYLDYPRNTHSAVFGFRCCSK